MLLFLLVNSEFFGTGEQGKPVIVEEKNLTTEERLEYQRGWANNAYNEFASNRMSLHRSLKNIPDYKK